MSTLVSASTLRVLAAECGQTLLYSHIETTPADVWADKKRVVIRIGTASIVEVCRMGHKDYRQIYSLGDFTNETDQVAFCKKVIHHMRQARRHRHHHHHHHHRHKRS